MGNAIITPCFSRPQTTSSSAVTLISHGGAIKILTGKHLAGEIMFEFPDHAICHADSFFIGHPIPSLAIDDELIRGHTYFLLPLDLLTSAAVSASSLAALGRDSSNKSRGSPVRFKDCPFEYVKGSDGRVLIKVVPEFIKRLITNNNNNGGEESVNGESNGLLCSTPELQKHYDQLVGCKDQRVWSPKLETISEYKVRFSPCRFLGLEWKQMEVET